MAAMALTNAQIVLAVVNAAVDADLSYIHLLAQRHKLKAELVLRVLLTFLPESTDPALYIPLLRDLNNGEHGLPESLAEATEGKSRKEVVGPEVALKQVKALRLLRLDAPDSIEAASTDTLSPTLTAFLLSRSRRIDIETGTLPHIQQLLEPFVDQCAYLKLWLGSTILPLLRLNYELFPDRQDSLTLEDFEDLKGGAALDMLIGGGIGGSNSADDYVRDLKTIVGPWMYGEVYRRRQRHRRDSNPATEERDENLPLLCWTWVNNWLMHIANNKPAIALAIARSSEWNGPGDVDDGGWIGEDQQIMAWIWKSPHRDESELFVATQQSYLKTCLCLFYTTADASEETFDALEELLLKIASPMAQRDLVENILHGFTRDDSNSVSPCEFLNAVQSRAHRLQPVELLEEAHPLTSLAAVSISFAAHLLRNARILLEFAQTLPISRVLHVSLLGTANEQRVLLQRLVQSFEDKKRSDDDCEELRTRLVDVATNPKSSDQGESWGVFGRIMAEDAAELDALIVKAEISSARYRHVVAKFLDNPDSRLPRPKVEEAAVQVALAAYDNASNGNRTRGGVKKASDIVAAFKASFPSSQALNETEALIRATHALSFYKLTLQHGVPCVPANIRIQHQPLSLIDRVLEQNPESSSQLDNLIGIAVDLVRAGLIKTIAEPWNHEDNSMPVDVDALSVKVQRQVTAKAISAAVNKGDFDTAYSYITTRLSSQASAHEDDDVLWRAAYAAGSAVPPRGGSGPRHLRRLEQKMELLSQALSLAPPSALADVLSTWQECESQVNEALAAETEEEERWNAQGDRGIVHDRHVPGGFGQEAFIHNAEGTGGRQFRGGRATQDEAPMGLFDVARAAGSALQKSVGGAGVGAGQGGHVDAEDGQRVRKRDMVSNAVTGGLVSGLGWVLGTSLVSFSLSGVCYHSGMAAETGACLDRMLTWD